MINNCPKCHNGMLQQAIVNGQQVVVCHSCKTIFGNGNDGGGDPSIVIMTKCEVCETFYYKLTPDTLCCTINKEVIEEKGIQNV